MMVPSEDLLSQATLYTIFQKELMERLKRALQELQAGPATCNYDAVHQEMDSLVGASRTMGIDWLEQDARVLAAYSRFLRNKREDTIDDPCHLLLVDVIIELKKQCQLLDGKSLASGQRPSSRVSSLLNGLQRKMELGNSSDYTKKHDVSIAPHKKPIVLVVDDSATSRLLFRAHLPEADKFELHEAEDMETAIHQAEKYQPDIVIMDYNMPQQNGVEIALKMRSKALEPVFILLTANIQQAVLDSANEAGFFSILEKPINRLKITRVFEELQL